MRRVILGAMLWAMLGASAHAGVCQATLPHKGQTFAGRAQLVHDGDTLCIGPGRDPATWIPVRLAGFYAPETYQPGGPEATRALRSIVGDGWIICTAGKRSFGRVVAHCTVRGQDLGDLMRSAGIVEGGRGFR